MGQEAEFSSCKVIFSVQGIRRMITRDVTCQFSSRSLSFLHTMSSVRFGIISSSLSLRTLRTNKLWQVNGWYVAESRFEPRTARLESTHASTKSLLLPGSWRSDLRLSELKRASTVIQPNSQSGPTHHWSVVEFSLEIWSLDSVQHYFLSTVHFLAFPAVGNHPYYWCQIFLIGILKVLDYLNSREARDFGEDHQDSFWQGGVWCTKRWKEQLWIYNLG